LNEISLKMTVVFEYFTESTPCLSIYLYISHRFGPQSAVAPPCEVVTYILYIYR